MSELDDLPPNTPPDRRLYVCIQIARYRHALVGVFDTLIRAKEAASDAIEAEHDHYHDIDIISCEPNRVGETFVGRMRPIRNYSGRPYEDPRLLALHFDTEE